MSAHSPGPWTWRPGKPDGPMPALVSAEGKGVCDFGDDEPYSGIPGTPPSEADRRLIIAAPELLAALKGVLEQGDRCACCKHPNCPWCSAPDLIARVEGKG